MRGWRPGPVQVRPLHTRRAIYTTVLMPPLFRISPHWAPFPTHSWPDAGTPKCEQMVNHANQIQAANAVTIKQQQAILNQNNC